MSSFFVISFCFIFVSFLIIRKFALSGQSLFTVVMPKMAGIIIFGWRKGNKILQNNHIFIPEISLYCLFF